MNLVAGVTIENTDTVTRQTLFNLLANALGGTVLPTDLENNLLNVAVGSAETSGVNPGTVLYDQSELLWKCFFDVIDSTGVSLWLSFGPDRFDEAFLAAEPIPYGAAIRLDTTNGNRWAKLTSGYQDPGVIGLSQTVGTVASGTWFRAAIEGLAIAWFPFKSNSTDTGLEAVSGGNIA